MRALLPLFWTIPLLAQPYDLLLKNGHVIDPKNGIDAARGSQSDRLWDRIIAPPTVGIRPRGKETQ